MRQLKARKQTQPVLHGANNIERLLQWSKSFHQLHWVLAQALGNKAFLMFFHVLWLLICLFLHFLLSFMSVGSIVSPPLTELHIGVHSTEHLPPLQEKQLKSNCWLRKTSALFVYLGFIKDGFIKAFPAFDCDSNATWTSFLWCLILSLW